MGGEGNGHHEPPAEGIRRPIAQYALSGILCVILLGGAGVYLMRNTGEREAIRNATHVAEVVGGGLIEPNLSPAVMRGDPRGIARLDRLVRASVLDDPIVRMKVWRRDGRIVYSDEHRLIGKRFPLDEDDLRAFQTGRAVAGISDLAHAENRFERGFDKLLEVYVPVRGPSNEPLLVETYERYGSIAASGRNLWLAFVPAMIGALAILWMIQLPLAWQGARRLREGQAARVRLLRRAIESSELERRRIARDLHDGAVQSLAGVSYSLAAAADTMDPASPERTRGALRDAASETRRTIRELRSLLVDIYPPDLHRTGLDAALRDLVAPLGPRGVEAEVELPPEARLSPAIETLFYRCAQEALRNVVKHADARHVEVNVAVDDGLARLTVADDGRGFEGPVEEGHVGLRLLADLAREAGGRLEVDSRRDEGTRIFVEAPR